LPSSVISSIFALSELFLLASFLSICSVLLFQHQPRSSLFPYTTLFRSDLGGHVGEAAQPVEVVVEVDRLPGVEHDRPGPAGMARDRKSTRLNSSHVKISYAVFCLKKKKTTYLQTKVYQTADILYINSKV